MEKVPLFKISETAKKAIEEGTLKIINVVIKGVEYELLEGYYYEHGMKKEFK